MDTGLSCLVLLMGFLDVPADPAHLKHEIGKDHAATAADIVRLAKRAGLRSRITTLGTHRLEFFALPTIARAKDGSFFIIGKVNEGRALVQVPGEAPQSLAYEDLDDLWDGTVIPLARRDKPTGGEGKFDVTWFIPALIKYRHLLRDVMLASLALQVFALGTPLFFQVVVDKVLAHQGLTTLDVLAIGLISLVVFEALMGGLRAYLFTHTTSRVDVELGSNLFRHLLKLPLAYFESRRVGDTVARVRELETIREFLTSSSVTLVIDLAFTVIFLVIMWFYSVALFTVVAVSIPLYVIISVIITPPLRRKIEEQFHRGADNQSFLVESVTAVQTLKAMAVEPQMQTRWENQLAGYVKSGFDAAKLGIIGQQAIQLVNKLASAIILYVGAKLVIEGQMTVGQLVAFNMFAGHVSQPILRMSHLWQQFQQVRVAVARLGDILNAPIERASKPSQSALPAIEGRIEFDGVFFRYEPGGREILRDVTLEIPPGQIVGIVGSSGSGKSTLAKLVQRLYVPESGRVLVDGVDLTMVDPAWLRRQVGVVQQENILFNRTVRDNIALADTGMAMERVVAAAHLAGAHDFILELPEGYDTQIDERGGNLSGGQRQRIAIARALAIDPRILVFDEATSALDAESDAAITANMPKIAANRTVFIIAHRLSTLRSANRIVTMENGKIVEDGSHDELMRRGGRYAQLWREQMLGLSTAE
ncbi:type I secretion system permease/ATPase [uncultured Algimonas sp.]|uniref:type I secretion system permease/ATPase n=1 Tax=uncultured Algimonas sp. TaxID=1547920 RepID=UPI00345016A1